METTVKDEVRTVDVLACHVKTLSHPAQSPSPRTFQFTADLIH